MNKEYETRQLINEVKRILDEVNAGDTKTLNTVTLASISAYLGDIALSLAIMVDKEA